MSQQVLRVSVLASFGFIAVSGFLFATLCFMGERVLDADIAVASGHLEQGRAGLAVLTPERGVELLEESLRVERGALGMMRATRSALVMIGAVALLGGACVVVLTWRGPSRSHPPRRAGA
jgi:hypothetical protein